MKETLFFLFISPEKIISIKPIQAASATVEARTRVRTCAFTRTITRARYAADDVIFFFFKSFFFFIRELIISILEKGEIEILLIEFRRTYDLQRQATSRRRRKMEIKVPFFAVGLSRFEHPRPRQVW